MCRKEYNQDFKHSPQALAFHSHVMLYHVQFITRSLRSRVTIGSLMRPWGPPPPHRMHRRRFADMRKRRGGSYYDFAGSRLRQMPGHFLNDVKSNLHERYLAFWCSNYRNLHPVCPMRMQNSDGLQILHSRLSRNQDSFEQNNKSKLLQSSFWCCKRALNLPALSPPPVRRYPPSPWVHLTQACCLLLVYHIRHQWCLRH